MILVACGTNTPPDDITDPGQLLFLGYANKDVNCARCHGEKGAGGSDAPDIRSVFIKYDEEKIIRVILFGTGDGPDEMPSFKDQLTGEQISLLLNFLKTIQQDTSLKSQ